MNYSDNTHEWYADTYDTVLRIYSCRATENLIITMTPARYMIKTRQFQVVALIQIVIQNFRFKIYNAVSIKN